MLFLFNDKSTLLFLSDDMLFLLESFGSSFNGFSSTGLTNNSPSFFFFRKSDRSRPFCFLGSSSFWKISKKLYFKSEDSFGTKHCQCIDTNIFKLCVCFYHTVWRPYFLAFASPKFSTYPCFFFRENIKKFSKAQLIYGWSIPPFLGKKHQVL